MRNLSMNTLLSALVISFWFSHYAHVPLQTTYLYGLGCSGFLVGVIIGIYGLAQVIIRFPLGKICDTNGKVYPYLLIGGITSPLAALLRLLFDSPGAFFAANLIGGVSAAMWIVVLSLYSRLFPADKLHHAISSAFASYSTGLLVSTLIAALFANRGMKSLAAWELASGVVFFSLCVMVTKRGRQQRENTWKTPSKETIRRVMRSKRLWAYSVLAFVHQGLILSAILSFSTQRGREIGASGFWIGLATLLYWLVCVYVGVICGKPLLTRLGARILIPLAMGIAAIYCVLLPHVDSVATLCLLQAVGGFFGGAPLPFAMSEGMKFVPAEARSTGIGVFQGILAGGMVVMPPLAGALIQHLGFQRGFYILGAIALATALYSVFLHMHFNRKKELLEQM